MLASSRKMTRQVRRRQKPSMLIAERLRLNARYPFDSVLLRSGPHQRAISRQVPNGFLGFLELLVEQRQVIVAIRQTGIAAQRRLVGLHRLRLAIPVIEEHAQVVEQQRIAATRLDRRAIDLLGLREAS